MPEKKELELEIKELEIVKAPTSVEAFDALFDPNKTIRFVIRDENGEDHEVDGDVTIAAMSGGSVIVSGQLQATDWLQKRALYDATWEIEGRGGKISLY